jgi:hypothetical protein
MKKYIKPILIFLFMASSILFSSCQEENVNPSNVEGNITRNDDWEKHNG